MELIPSTYNNKSDMDSALDDDICILTHEKADCVQRRDQHTPFSASSGEASVASHFALVTAYEDIKKRLKETEKENYSLKKKLRQMDEKLSGKNETSLVEQNFYEVCIERDNLLNRLNMMEKERLECTKTLNEQLQSKDLELLQIRTELDTHQVMKSLNKHPSDWEIEKMNKDLKMRSLEQELQLNQEECHFLRAELQRKKDSAVDMSEDCQNLIPESESSMRQAFWELKKEMSNLHLMTEVQGKVLRKLKATVTASKKVYHTDSVQEEEDFLKDYNKLQLSAACAVPNEHMLSSVPASKPQGHMNRLLEKPDFSHWTHERPIPVGGTDSEDSDSYQKPSFGEGSWVIPSPPKPNETLFWETKNDSSKTCVARYYNAYDDFKS
ncbi:5-azacytidine-induced protein 2 [Xenopus laevis]|uniref:5-azacytidine-induced protein 2 n=2 Tax=Xenopus laevis TaxID=8355 RepID=A0A974HDQ7_XENLA|nr:5-azacytidine-induced protein 2 [Xenopus laevis]OCT74177.1 hypothetical protein XELAEV_18033133mg [Xenopus laevis]